jgi:DNA (cytosine-5)-methyltransferase 1
VRAYYNDSDPYCCEWLENLVAAGEIAQGDVDRRPIEDVSGDDLRGYGRVHLFAGIGGWDLALRLAKWPDDAPVWTGSCPCQPFSSAGRQLGATDPRHMWPHMLRLIRECRPQRVFGEQVATAIRHGWLDGVCADLETVGYAVGACVLGAHSVSAPHRRQRLWWVADAERGSVRAGGCGAIEGQERALQGTESERQRVRLVAGASRSDERCSVAHGIREGLQRGRGDAISLGYPRAERTGGQWGAAWLHCEEGRFRRVEPTVLPVAYGLPKRLASVRARLGNVAGDARRAFDGARKYRAGAIHGYGNAIVPQVAAEFIGAYMEVAADRADEEDAE